MGLWQCIQSIQLDTECRTKTGKRDGSWRKHNVPTDTLPACISWVHVGIQVMVLEGKIRRKKNHKMHRPSIASTQNSSRDDQSGFGACSRLIIEKGLDNNIKIQCTVPSRRLLSSSSDYWFSFVSFSFCICVACKSIVRIIFSVNLYIPGREKKNWRKERPGPWASFTHPLKAILIHFAP